MSIEQTDEKIIKRIKVLLAKAKDSSSPEEAVIAAKRARHLMDKHQVDKNDVEQFKKGGFGETMGNGSHRQVPKWKSILSLQVAGYNDCKVELVAIKELRWRMRFTFKGYEADAIIAVAMFEYLCEAIDRHVKNAQLESRIHGPGEANSFRLGASLSLCNRLRELIQERKDKEESSSGKELMIIKRDLVAQHFGVQTFRQTNTQGSHSDAQYQGREAGNKIGLHGQVKGGQNFKAIH